MKTRLLTLSIMVSMCVAVSVVGADVRKLLSDSGRAADSIKGRSFTQRKPDINARTYRSSGRYHKVMVGPANPAAALAFARDSGSIEIADYGSYKLLASDESIQNDGLISRTSRLFPSRFAMT